MAVLMVSPGPLSLLGQQTTWQAEVELKASQKASSAGVGCAGQEGPYQVDVKTPARPWALFPEVSSAPPPGCL